MRRLVSTDSDHILSSTSGDAWRCWYRCSQDWLWKWSLVKVPEFRKVSVDFSGRCVSVCRTESRRPERRDDGVPGEAQTAAWKLHAHGAGEASLLCQGCRSWGRYCFVNSFSRKTSLNFSWEVRPTFLTYSFTLGLWGWRLERIQKLQRWGNVITWKTLQIFEKGQEKNPGGKTKSSYQRDKISVHLSI